MEYRVDNTIFLRVYSICPDMRKMKAIERFMKNTHQSKSVARFN